MIHLNGAAFAENDAEFIESLFTGGRTCCGYAKRHKHSVTLLDHQKNKIAVINREGVLCCATKLEDRRYWYSHATVDIIGRWDSYTKQREECLFALHGVEQ